MWQYQRMKCASFNGARKLPFAAKARLFNGGYWQPWGTAAVGQFLLVGVTTYIAGERPFEGMIPSKTVLRGRSM
jgi:hypothetical protein